jgi:cytochrome c oxidase assembly factor CtaG
VHLHLLIGGYLFAIALISVDPLPHRPGYQHRSIVLILVLTGPGILAKYLFAHPAAGVAGSAAEAGSVLTYSGGDSVEVMIMIILGWCWCQSERPRQALVAEARSAVSPLGGDVVGVGHVCPSSRVDNVTLRGVSGVDHEPYG